MATDKLELNVAGMTCVNCSNAIEKVTAKMDGVEEAKVSFASSKAEFIIDPMKVKPEDIKQKIKKLGYSVVEDLKALEVQKKKDLKKLKYKAIQEIKQKSGKTTLAAPAPLSCIVGP